MTELLARVSELFVAPAAGRRTVPISVVRPAPAVAVLCPPAQALPLGSAVALALGALAHRPCASLAMWCPAGGPARLPRAPGLAAARRTAGAATRLGFDTHASGRIARIVLPGDADAAGAAAQRLAGLDVPTAVVLAGPRDERVDHLLAMQDAVVVPRPAEADDALAGLVLDGLPAGMALPLAAPRAGAVAWWAASVGLGLAAPLRRSLTAVLHPAVG